MVLSLNVQGAAILREGKNTHQNPNVSSLASEIKEPVPLLPVSLFALILDSVAILTHVHSPLMKEPTIHKVSHKAPEEKRKDGRTLAIPARDPPIPVVYSGVVNLHFLISFSTYYTPHRLNSFN
jgi:hypothetical protein